MARGKDGFNSLLVRSEGGEAEEVVSEENGILISMMLRQYFMSLKIIGQWKMWGKSMDRHWKGVQKSMSATQSALELQPKANNLEEAAGSILASQRKKEIRATAITESYDPLDESDDDMSADEAEDVKVSNAKQERDMKLARKVMKKWWRLAGLPGQPKCCDEVLEFNFDWTRVRIIFFCAESRSVLAGSLTWIYRQSHQDWRAVFVLLRARWIHHKYTPKIFARYKVLEIHGSLDHLKRI